MTNPHDPMIWSPISSDYIASALGDIEDRVKRRAIDIARVYGRAQVSREDAAEAVREVVKGYTIVSSVSVDQEVTT